MNVKKDIEKRGVTQEQYAALLGVTPTTVTLWLNGKRKQSRQSQMLMKLSSKKLREIHVKQ